MKKTYQLHVEGKNPDRLLESIKNEIRKYLKRERKKDLPDQANYITFNCKIGPNEQDTKELHAGEIIQNIDAIVKAGKKSFFVEITSAYATRSPYDNSDENTD